MPGCRLGGDEGRQRRHRQSRSRRVGITVDQQPALCGPGWITGRIEELYANNQSIGCPENGRLRAAHRAKGWIPLQPPVLAAYPASQRFLDSGRNVLAPPDAQEIDVLPQPAPGKWVRASAVPPQNTTLSATAAPSAASRCESR